MKDVTREYGGEPRVVGRRSILTAATWSIPVMAASISTPLAAASAGAGTLLIIGNAFADESFSISPTYDSAGATLDYPAGAFQITITLPEIAGTVDNFFPERPAAYSVTRVGQSIVFTNTVAFRANTGQYSAAAAIAGAFPVAAPYTISILPSTVGVIFMGNLRYEGGFAPPK